MPKEPTSRASKSTAGPTRGGLAQRFEVNGELSWKTKIPEKRLIWKKLAKTKYRLDDEHLKGYVHDIAHDDDGMVTVKYFEHVVQHLAWKLYGGPTEYWKMLKVDLQAYVEKYRTREGFLYPHDYLPGGLYDLNKTDPPPTEPRPLPAPPATSLIPQVPERVDPDIGSSRASAVAKERVPVWLWAACTNALDTNHGSPTRPGASTRVREEAMRVLAQQFYQAYPARPNPNIAMRTIATHNFFYVLDGAPCAPGRSSQTWGTDVLGLEFVPVGDGPDGLYEWSETYLERLFTEVNGLVTRFGLGDAGGGWQTIRWVIYDKYVKCLNRGPQYDCTAKRWFDDAKFWLDEHQYEAGSEELRVSLRDRCAAGRHFNSLLPLRRPTGTVAA